MRPLAGTFPEKPFIYPITDRNLATGLCIEDIVAELCRGGARFIQLREKNLTTKEFHEIAARAVETAHSSGAALVVNDRVDVALYAGADGVHLGDDEISPAAARKVLGENRIIGISCHSLDDVKWALREPIDYFAVGPVFPTDTKKLSYEVVGLELVRAARELTEMTMVAIGGISRETAGEVVAAGADAVAVIGAVMAPTGIEELTRGLIASIEKR